MGVPRGKVIGGTSSINGQVFLRAIPEDFENWESMGLDDWSFEDCFTYIAPSKKTGEGQWIMITHQDFSKPY